MCGMKRWKKQKKAQTTSELPEELVLEILIRLPVESLRRFKCVSKARRTTISDPSFIRSHLQRSVSRWEQNPSLLITPHTIDGVAQGENWPTTFSSSIRFYQWQQGASKARLVHGRDFDGEFSSVCGFAHCDGLVLLPTDTNVYLFNPATRDVLTLPESSRNKRPGITVLPVGFGRDPRTRMYKVVRSFFRSRDPETGLYNMGMEVCTVGGGAGGSVPCWRETASDQPYPVEACVTTQTTVKGGTYWIIDKRHLKPRPHGILRFGLEDETFSVTRLPDELDPGDDDFFHLDVMGGELCLTGSLVGEPDEHPLIIWALVEDGGPGSLWEQRYRIYVTDLFHPLALLPNSGAGGGRAMMIWLSHKLYRYDLHSNELTVVCELERLRYERQRTGSFRSAQRDVYFFNVIPYTESLVSITD